MCSRLGLGLVAVVMAFGRPSGAQAQEEARPLLLVVDGTSLPVGAEELRRALELAFGRPVVRPHDVAAASADETLLLASTGTHRWVLRRALGFVVVLRVLDAPASSVEVWVAAAVALDAEMGRALATSRAPTPASEIVDPFVGPRVPALTVAFRGALVDPFACDGGPLAILGSPDIVDPWR